MLPSVEYLGHKISDKGIQPTEVKIRGIVEVPAPNNVSQLKAFLSMLNYYTKFLLNISSRLAPFYKLLQKQVPWSWKGEQQEAFQKATEALSMLNYYTKFLLNISSRLAPFYKLLQKQVPWSWKGEQQEAFQKATEAFTSADVLVHYNLSLRVTLSYDVLSYDVEAVLSHKLDNGTEHSVAFASCSLSLAEKK